MTKDMIKHSLNTHGAVIEHSLSEGGHKGPWKPIPKKSESTPRITGARRLINGETQRNACGPLHRYVTCYVTRDVTKSVTRDVTRDVSRDLENPTNCERYRTQTNAESLGNIRSTSARRPFNLDCYKHCASPGKVVPSREITGLSLTVSLSQRLSQPWSP